MVENTPTAPAQSHPIQNKIEEISARSNPITEKTKKTIMNVCSILFYSVYRYLIEN